MTRLLLYLLGKTDYESCKSCETLKQQLEIANFEKQQLTDTLLGLLKPKVYEQPARELQPLENTLQTFSRRKQKLEEEARQRARILRDSPFVASNVNKPVVKLSPDLDTSSVKELEEELGIDAEGEKLNG